ncbi:MAG: hypothetical protein ABIJ09_14605 [Pseudomonadota bacterium]
MISDRNVRFLAVLSMVAVFVAGIAVGLVADRLLEGSRGGHRPPPPGPPLEHLLERFSGELDLKASQQQAIQEILQQGRVQAEQILGRARPELDATRKGMEERIIALLDPEQAAKYREMLERHPGPPAGPPLGPPPGGHPPGPGPQGFRPPPPGPPGAGPAQASPPPLPDTSGQETPP